MKVTQISDYAVFSRMATEWKGLIDSSSQYAVFLCHDWLRTWWETYGVGFRLCVLLVREDSDARLVGALPGYVRVRGSVCRVKELRFMGSEGVTSDYLEPLAERGREEEVYSTLLRYMTDSCVWDIAALDDITSTSPFLDHIRQHHHSSLHLEIRDDEKRCPYISLPGDWETYRDSRSDGVRRRIKRYRRYLDERGQVAVERISDQGSLQTAIHDLVDLHQKRKAEVGLKGRFVSERYLSFHTRIMSLYQEHGALFLSFLTVGGKRVAFYYGFQFRDQLFMYQSGFDPEWSSMSVSFVLLSYVVENAILDGVSYFDFLRGHEKFKYDWTASENRLLDVTLYRGSSSVRLFRFERFVIEKTKGIVKLALPTAIRSSLRRLTSDS
jgi:CelD/BcsL family acetyltransferase involved in cellulose biosynthesis